MHITYNTSKDISLSLYLSIESKLSFEFLQMDNEDSPLENMYGFGAAKHFMPLPNTVVGSHCAWELRLNTVPNRIPGKGKHSFFLECNKTPR